MRFAFVATLALCSACAATSHEVPLNHDDGLRMLDVTVTQQPMRTQTIPEIMAPSEKSLEIVDPR